MKITAFALFSLLFGSFGNYPPPAEETAPELVFFTSTQSSKVNPTEKSRRPGFAGRERHWAIRYKSGHAQGPAHSRLSATIPSRIYPLYSLLFITSPQSVSTQTETSQPMLVFFTNITDNQLVGEEHQQGEAKPHMQSTTSTDSVAVEVCPSSEEKKLYDLIMAYRKSKRLPPIPYSAKLSKVAQTHVRDLEANYNYENASTCNPHSWSNKGTWTSCCYTSDHKQASCMWTKPKEIAGYEGYGYEIAYYSSAGANAAEGLEGWKKSQGHNPLIINSGTWSKVKWQAIGIGIYGQYGVVWFGEEADESKMKLCK